MNRRSFIRIGLAGTATGIIAPQTVLAGAGGSNINQHALAGGVYYTKESPGRWSKKAAPHLPVLKKTDSGIQVTTGHPMNAGKHWIVKHMILDSNFKFIGEKVFDPTIDKAAISDHTLKGVTGTVYALSVCNLHDTWLSSIEI